MSENNLTNIPHDPDKLSLKTASGHIFGADIERKNDTIPHDTVNLTLKPKGCDEAIDIATIQCLDDPNDPDAIRILFFGDLSTEEPTHILIVTGKEIREIFQD